MPGVAVTGCAGVGWAVGWAWNPFSALAAASRHLFGNADPATAVHMWPMQHPEQAVPLWSAVLLLLLLLLLLVPAPLTVHLYRRKVARPVPLVQCRQASAARPVPPGQCRQASAANVRGTPLPATTSPGRR